MSPDIVQCSQFSAVAALSLHQMQSSRSGSILDPASATAAIAEARAASRLGRRQPGVGSSATTPSDGPLAPRHSRGRGPEAADCPASTACESAGAGGNPSDHAVWFEAQRLVAPTDRPAGPWPR